MTRSPSAPPTWQEIAKLAEQAGAKHPKLVAAQFCLESDFGRAVSGRFNYFGIKGPGTAVPTQEVVNGKTINIRAAFKDFASPAECVAYLVDRWYKDFRSFRGVNRAPSQEAAARDLMRQGYATDPRYADKLINLLRTQIK